MKRGCVALLALVLFMGMSLPAGAASRDANLSPPEGESFYTMAAMGDALYLLSPGGLYRWRTGEAEPTLLGKMPEKAAPDRRSAMAFSSGGAVVQINGYFIDHLIVWDNKLCGLDSDEGVLYLMEAVDGAVVLTQVQALDWKAMPQSQGGKGFPVMVSDSAAADGFLYLLKSGMDLSATELYRFSLSDGGFLKYDVSLLAGFVPYTGGKALILQYASQEDARDLTGRLWLNVLDLQTGEIRKGLELPVARAEGLAYDPGTDTAAFFSGGEIYAVDALSQCRLAGYAPAATQWLARSRGQMLEGGLYALCGEQVSVRAIAKGGVVARALRISNPTETSYKEFAQKYPDIPVVLGNTSFDSAEALMQDMAGGGSDLYCLRIDALDYRALLDKGYAADLSQSGVLMDQVREMYPFIRKELLKDGDLLAFPVSLSGPMLGYSERALSELNLTKEDLPHTFAEMMAFITGWEAAYGEDHPSLALFEGQMFGDPKERFFSWLLENYSAYYHRLGGNLSFDTLLMEKLLSALEEADLSAVEAKDVQKAMVSGMTGSVAYSFSVAGGEPPATALLTMYNEAVLSEYGMQLFAPLPIALDEGLDPVVPASLTVYVVNPYSKNKDLAMTYLEHFATKRSAVSRMALSAQDNEPVISARYEVIRAEKEKEIADIRAQLDSAPAERKKDLQVSLKAAEDSLTFLESIKWQVSKEQLAQYRERVAWLSVSNVNPLTLVAKDQSMAALLGRYNAGQLSRAQLLAALDQKLAMVYRENK